MIRGLLLAVLLAGTAAAQAPRCGFGLGLEALREADRRIAEGLAAEEMLAGREAAADAATALAEATGRLDGCGCPQAAARAREAASLAEQARSEASRQRIRIVLDRARFSLRQTQDSLGRLGCG